MLKSTVRCIWLKQSNQRQHNLAKSEHTVKTKRKINSLASTVIVYRQDDPSQVFLEMKDNSHPMELVRGLLCTPGGHWSVAGDANPRATIIRELREEWSLVRKPRDSQELVDLGLVATTESFAATPINQAVEQTPADVAQLEQIKQAIIDKLEPFRDRINTIPREAVERVDPNNLHPGFNVLISYFTAGLNEQDWAALKALQLKYGNISAECISVMTSLDEIIRKHWYIAFGHDHGLKTFFDFFLSSRYPNVDNLPLVEGIVSEGFGLPRDSYQKYLEMFDILKHPLK